MEVEGQEGYSFSDCNTLDGGLDRQKYRYHIMLASDVGLVTKINPDSKNSLYRMTSAGHDYLDAIRDPKRWKRVKEEAAGVGGAVGLELLKKLAVGMLKTQLEKHTGIEL